MMMLAKTTDMRIEDVFQFQSMLFQREILGLHDCFDCVYFQIHSFRIFFWHVEQYAFMRTPNVNVLASPSLVTV